MQQKLIIKKNNKSAKTDDAEYIELVHSGEDYFLRMQKIIESAQKEIHLQTYIFDNDETGISIGDSLKKAAQRNVKVYVLLDGYGSAKLPASFAEDLMQHGISFRFFSPLFSFNNFYIGRRMHHKVLVADGRTALIGGINVADKYRGTATETAWLDYAIQIECPAADALQTLCRNIFFKKKGLKKIKSVFHKSGNTLIGIIQNDWLLGKTEVCDAYTNAISNAQKEIGIAGSYFLPGQRLSKALKKACKNGVDTTLILAGVSDVPLVRRATTYLYASFLRHHMKLYEWNKSVLHGKAAVVDKKWATIGSFNLNSLSCYGSIEMNVAVQSSGFAEIVRTDFDKVIRQCQPVTLKTLQRKSGLFNRLTNWFSYQIIRITISVITFFPHNRFLKKLR